MKFPRSNVCNAVGPIRSDPIQFCRRVSLPSHRDSFELYLLWRISFSSPSSLSSLPPSFFFVRVLARHVIVPYLAADGRADLRGRRYLLPFHFSFEKKSDVVLSQFRCKHMVSCLLFRIDACSLKVPTSQAHLTFRLENKISKSKAVKRGPAIRMIISVPSFETY